MAGLHPGPPVRASSATITDRSRIGDGAEAPWAPVDDNSDPRNVLVLSVWNDGGQFRARILSEPPVVDARYQGSIDDVLTQVRQWLVAVEQS